MILNAWSITAELQNNGIFSKIIWNDLCFGFIIEKLGDASALIDKNKKKQLGWNKKQIRMYQSCQQ